MISRNIYVTIVLRVLVIVLLSLAAGWLAGVKHLYFPAFLVLTAIVGVAFSLVHHLNSTNRKLCYFFESVQNEDSMLGLRLEPKNKVAQELEQALNKINQRIQQLKIESRQQEQYFQMLLEHAATGLITFNSKGFILHANSAAKKMVGAGILTHIRQIERINQKLYLNILNIKPFEQKLVSLPTEKGAVDLLLKASLFKIKNEELVLLAIQDIKNELDEKELDSWFRLIRVLMHEIMNSIAPITSLSETLSRYYTVGDRAVLPDELSGQVIQSTIRGLNVIKEQGNSLIAFVESYRKFTRLPKPEKKLFKASELLDRVKILYYSVEDSRNAGLKVTVTPPGLEIFADESQISLVLINLVKNALQANEKNAAGEIEVVVCQNTHLRPEILVRDNGPGIAAEMMDEIFVPFFTTRENGSGVGLSISKQIMRLHGGNLHVRSVPGKETVFRMTF